MCLPKVPERLQDLHERGMADDVPASVSTSFDTTSWYAADLTYRVYESGDEATIAESKENWLKWFNNKFRRFTFKTRGGELAN